MDNQLQIVSVIIILSVFIIGVAGINSKGKTLPSISSNAPTILTSFGIFFTFLGILIALSNFDVKDVNGSVPRLLDGLRLAFLSSVVGLRIKMIVMVRVNKSSLKMPHFC